jgi:hypothetical protein
MASHTPIGSLRPYTTGVSTFPVFISSADEAMPFRNRVQNLVEKSLNSQLSRNRWPEHFPVWRWEERSSTTVPAGGNANDLFVQMARESSVTIVLLRDKLRPGTREELMAVKDDEEVELKVLWFPRRRPRFAPASEVERFLMSEEAGNVFYNRIVRPDSELAWQVLAANVIDVLLLALRSTGRRPYVARI